MSVDWRELISRGAMLFMGLLLFAGGLGLTHAANVMLNPTDGTGGEEGVYAALAALALFAASFWLGFTAFRPKWKP
jgi:hypothetical protein